MGSLIDSSILIAAERGDEALQAALALLAPFEDHYLSAMTVAEMLHGVHRASPARLEARRASVERLITAIPTLPFDAAAARVFARLDAELRSTGNTVATADLIIAATAIANGHGVMTRDARSFPKIPGLTATLV